MLKGCQFGIIAVFVLLSSTQATPVKAKKESKIKIVMSAQAKRILVRNQMTLEGGLLRKRGTKDGANLGMGSDALYVIVDPRDKEALAVANYQKGELDTVVAVSFPHHRPLIAPFSDPGDKTPEKTIAKLFPKKL